MSINYWQRKFLADRGVKTPQELPTVTDKLDFANLASKPDPEPDDDSPPMTPAAAQWLGDRDPEKLGDESKELLHWLNTAEPFQPKMPEAPKTAPRTTLNTASIVALDPVHRLTVIRASETLVEARRERASGGDPRTFRFSDAQVAAAELLTRPHWNDEC